MMQPGYSSGWGSGRSGMGYPGRSGMAYSGMRPGYSGTWGSGYSGMQPGQSRRWGTGSGMPRPGYSGMTRPGYSGRWGMGFSGMMRPGQSGTWGTGYSGMTRPGYSGWPTRTNSSTVGRSGHVGRFGGNSGNWNSGATATNFVGHPGMTKMANSGAHAKAMRHINYLLNHHDSVYRHVETIPCGIRSLTVARNPYVAEAIIRHVAEMKRHMENSETIRSCDPIFQAAFLSAGNIVFNITNLRNGVLVEEYSRSCFENLSNKNSNNNVVNTDNNYADDCTEQVIVQHAATITKFVENGRTETAMCKQHEAPSCYYRT